MSDLEQELVFELMKNGSTAKDVLEVTENMRNPNLSKIPPINLNQKQVEQAIKRYELKQNYETFKKNKGCIKKEAKRRKKELIKQKIIKLKKNPLTLRIEIWDYGTLCKNCEYTAQTFYAKTLYLKRTKNGSFVKKKSNGQFILGYCPKCYSIFDREGNEI